MGLFDLITAPLRGVTEIYDDLSGKNKEEDQGLSILTMGGSSLVKGTIKGIKKGLDIDD